MRAGTTPSTARMRRRPNPTLYPYSTLFRSTLSNTNNSTAQSLTQSGGTLNGVGSLTVTGSLNWSGGEMTATAHASIPATGPPPMLASTNDPDHRMLTTNGTATRTCFGLIAH